jgi:peptidoglycan-N-acetylglucosamine deacetylase
MSILNSVIAPIFFPSILWHAADHTVHLTFDDGPHPSATPSVLDLLKKRNIRATFFLLGKHVRRFPDLARLVAQEGHAIGNHGFSHESLIFKSGNFQRREIQSGRDTIGDIAGITPSLFRPPFGFFDWRTVRLAEETGHKIMLWDVDAKDFSSRSDAGIMKSISKQTRPGSIILLHDNEDTAVRGTRYLDAVLDRLTNAGLSFATLIP